VGKKEQGYIDESKNRDLIMQTAPEIVSEHSVEVLEFRELRKKSPMQEILSDLVKDFGIVYVTSITRDGCSGCETQKPLFKELAGRVTVEHSSSVYFRNIHVHSSEDDKQESWESKRVFHHAAYPTYMIHVRSHAGPLEVFRAIYPSMEELEKQVRETFELADLYKSETGTKIHS